MLAAPGATATRIQGIRMDLGEKMAKRNSGKTEASAKAQAPAAESTAAAQGPNTLAAVLGEVVSLLMMPASHKHLFLADLEWLVVPPLALRQFRLWRQDDRPVGFATWALLSEEVEARLLSGVRRLKPADWNSGDRAWLIDVVAPNPEAAQKMVAELKAVVFSDRPLKALQARPEGGSAAVEV
jgi:cytolysin-activating lysine-acyltransferase